MNDLSVIQDNLRRGSTIVLGGIMDRIDKKDLIKLLMILASLKGHDLSIKTLVKEI